MDIDFVTDYSTGTFQITLGENPQSVTGNRKLLNRFEITFLTSLRQYVLGGVAITDSYGGNSSRFINSPQSTANIQSISSSLTVAVEQTVQCMLVDQQGKKILDTERLLSAELISIDVLSDAVTATIKVNPVSAELYQDLIFNFPVARI